jgi:hypothetical protein
MPNLILFLKNLLKEKPLAKASKFTSEKKLNKYDSVITNYRQAIKSSGYKSTKLCYLMRDFGYKRRGSSNLKRIDEALERHKLHCYPKLSKSMNWKKNLQIYEFPVREEGYLYNEELELQKEMKKQNVFTQLGVSNVQREMSPPGTKDRLDFYSNVDNSHVIIEVKNRDGGKSAVEQILRYNGVLKNCYPNEPVRNILVTGISDFWTAYAIHGMMQEQRNRIEWYLYKCDKKGSPITLVPMDYENYKKYFAPHTPDV